jgi:hypothetical protein
MLLLVIDGLENMMSRGRWTSSTVSCWVLVKHDLGLHSLPLTCYLPLVNTPAMLHSDTNHTSSMIVASSVDAERAFSVGRLQVNHLQHGISSQSRGPRIMVRYSLDVKRFEGGYISS